MGNDGPEVSDYLYMSLGAGVQSSAMYILAEQGEIPRPEVAIFADTQDEPPWVYDQLEALEAWSTIPIRRVTAGKISGDMGTRGRFATIPAFTVGSDGKAAPLRRQCTREYKIAPIQKEVRRLMGYKPRQRIPEGGATCQLGITVDEVTRMRPSRDRWVINSFPLIEAKLHRDSCRRIVEEAGFPSPRKSSCIFCPYHGDLFWHDLKTNHPEIFEEACGFDDRIRDMTKAGDKKPAYLHRSLKPLREVEFIDERQGMFDWMCDSGHCGV